MSLALIAALPFLGALLPGLLIRSGRNACALATGTVTALALLMLGLHAPAVLSGEVIHTRIEWMPALGLNANFFLDGLGLLFAGLILGIGLLIILYARFYLSSRDPMGQFYTYLLLFQGAMVGIVLSDNILLLLVFWELTSLSSFLLIGYWKHLPEGRQGARMALAVTGTGGLAMIAGMLILGQIAGSYDLSVILQSREAIQASDWYLPALVLILLGCFTKSAQFPFHFWLPHAMAAPTPVSAYLHSATMVKAGLFLMARMWPVLAGTPEWFYLVATTGLVTMVVAAKIALFKDDLKALLAFSTVSHLGLVTMLLGFGTKAAAIAAIFHIINHATFKAALFMCAGIVDHETHTRDLKRLGGLRRLMPVTFALSTIAALSMAGVPPLNGFLSKEMMLEEVAHTAWAGQVWLMPAFATLGALFSVAYSLRFIAHGFLGPVRKDYPSKPHDPPFGMWAAPAVLVLLLVAIGLAPMPVAGWLVDAAAGATTGGLVHAHISHWHGLTPALWMSVAAIGGGLILLSAHRPLMRAWLATPRPEAKRLFDGVLEPLATAARGVTQGLHDGALSRYFAIATVAVVTAGAAAFLTGSHQGGTRAPTPVDLVPVVGWFLLIAATVALVLRHHDRFLSLVFVGVVGLIVSMGFAYLSAPDLALTQILVEVATVILLLLALNFLPKRTPAETGLARRLRDGAIACAAGLGSGGLIYLLMTRNAAFPSIADYHLANAKTGGGGTNVVNVILVDFRGFDTFGEITVLGIAALVIFALTETVLRAGPANDRLLGWSQRHRQAGDRHPLMFVVATRMVLPIALMVGIYIFLRGHNLPGGGFIAGLVVAVAALMQYMASGFGWTSARKRVEYHALIAVGVLIAAAAGVGSWFAGRPFLTSAYGYVTLPPLEKFELATAMVFDIGVFLTVLGAVMLALASISRIAVRAGERVSATPYDVDLPGDGYGDR
ncbi:multisubunit potassium/proton antiporter PhaA subunit /multisubunit potassium/proton antiporter PhaB subunit [Cereibacter ovatus]|uniref:Multisubunit potassium/proton antiporter PhaA subunit /multisubunit potassium/proton antiporter PhaB subunit n=1 Tax=Cereibacter ovatus TaxID=439529 RepID=A0A285CVD8_9RHOB|nr:monovalent cation/H+ antiporter subunit A [Cereibacter ovatus]SNX71008.1 multisubunit potassium/proton antiporter PhaA subunit /multisubunit potassium/proton antiporter PhaB subunit [Cereibacter ovatus]